MPDPRQRRDAGRMRDAADQQPRSIVDEASEESFPASDAPAWAPPTRVGAPRHEDAASKDAGNSDVAPAVDRALDARMDDRRS